MRFFTRFFSLFCFLAFPVFAAPPGTEAVPASTVGQAAKLGAKAAKGKQQDEDDHDPMVTLSESVITIPIQDGVSIDDAIQSMKSKASEINLKLVGHNPLWKEFEAKGFDNIRRAEIFQFCSARTAKEMLDFDINFMAYMPCRIGVVMDKNNKAWLVTMNLNIFISAENLPENLRKLAFKIRDDIELIMEAGAAGEL